MNLLPVAPQPTGWQPIETAPNEQGVDVWVKSHRNPDFGLRLTNVHRVGYRWFVPDHYSREPYCLSHWMPLPPAPQTADESTSGEHFASGSAKSAGAAPLPDDVARMVERLRNDHDRNYEDEAADMLERQQRSIAELEAERIAAPLPDDVQRMVRRLYYLHDEGYTFAGETADIIKRQQRSIAELEAQYHELIMAVGNKFQGETRHQTALRYILAAEAPRAIDAFMSAAPKEG